MDTCHAAPSATTETDHHIPPPPESGVARVRPAMLHRQLAGRAPAVRTLVRATWSRRADLLALDEDGQLPAYVHRPDAALRGVLASIGANDSLRSHVFAVSPASPSYALLCAFYEQVAHMHADVIHVLAFSPAARQGTLVRVARFA